MVARDPSFQSLTCEADDGTGLSGSYLKEICIVRWDVPSPRNDVSDSFIQANKGKRQKWQKIGRLRSQRRKIVVIPKRLFHYTLFKQKSSRI